MSTLTEIEIAVDSLPPEQQQELLRHLAATVRRRRSPSYPASVEQWMERLDRLRATISTGHQTMTTEQIFSDAREERD